MVIGDDSLMAAGKQQVIAELEERGREIRAVCGAIVRYEVAWDTFHDDQEALQNIARVSGYAVKRAVQLICRDETGKAAVRSGFHRVKLANVTKASDNRVDFLNGVLEIHCAYALGRSDATGYEAIRAALEKSLGTGQSDAYAHFVKSMDIGMEQWRDGTGYELDALARMTPSERAIIEEMLIRHLADPGDWRDVEALAALGTEAAMDAVGKARKHADLRIREHALTYFLATGSADRGIEDDVVRAVKQGAIDLARQCPTPRVKRALLDRALSAEGAARVNAAALLLYLCGQAPEPFDWNQRPFFLRFGEDNPEEVKAAWEELRRRTGL